LSGLSRRGIPNHRIHSHRTSTRLGLLPGIATLLPLLPSAPMASSWPAAAMMKLSSCGKRRKSSASTAYINIKSSIIYKSVQAPPSVSKPQGSLLGASAPGEGFVHLVVLDRYARIVNVLLCHASDWNRSTHVSCMALHSSARDIDLEPNTSNPCLLGGVAAHALAI
jgi:hypothetical protein